MTDPSKWSDSREFWPGKRVCVTGGAGFLGSYVVLIGAVIFNRVEQTFMDTV